MYMPRVFLNGNVMAKVKIDKDTEYVIVECRVWGECVESCFSKEESNFYRKEIAFYVLKR